MPSFSMRLLAALFLCLSSSAVYAQEKTGSAPGFSLDQSSARIILMRPDIRVGAQSTGGMFEANADWTQQSRENIDAQLEVQLSKLGTEIVRYDESLSGGSPLVDQYTKLFGAVAGSVLEYQFFSGNRLPTKKRDIENFDWTMGPGLQDIEGLDGADYVLFIYTHDAYGSTGRKLLQFAAMFAGVGVSSGVHTGYAGLVDLKTGQLVWLNADAKMGGDVRTAEGAEKRVSQLLEDFPGTGAEDQK